LALVLNHMRLIAKEWQNFRILPSALPKQIYQAQAEARYWEWSGNRDFGSGPTLCATARLIRWHSVALSVRLDLPAGRIR